MLIGLVLIISVPDWLKTFSAIVLFTFFHYNIVIFPFLTTMITRTNMQWVVDVNDFCFWSEWFLWVCSYEQKQPQRFAPEKCIAVHEFRILAKFLKSTWEDFEFWINLFRIIFQGFCLLYRNTYFKKYFWLAAFLYITRV